MFLRMNYLYLIGKLIDLKKIENTELDSLSRFLGTPSAQRIFQLLICWDSLSIKEIIQKTGISESQSYSTLNNS